MKTERKLAWLSLALLLPAPTLGVLFGMVWFADTTLGQGCFAASKVWLLALPLIWHLAVDRRQLSASPARRGGFGVGITLGLGISAIILIAYLLVARRLIDPEAARETIRGVGLSTPGIYIAAATYWCTINSALEEYVWRWFVVQQFQRAGAGGWAIPLAALGFTVHHMVAMQTYFSWPVVLIASAGIFIGGAAWSWCYVRYRSIWPGYISHAIVDVAVFAIGYAIVFG